MAGRAELAPRIPLEALQRRPFYVTQNGRPIRENSAHPSVRAQQEAAGVVTEMRRCPFDDSRQGTDKLMNQSSFAEIMRPKPESESLIGAFRWIYHTYLAYRPEDQTTPYLTISEVNDMSHIASWMPAYLVLRAERNFFEDDLPNVVGDVFKVGHGIESATEPMVQVELESRPATGELIYQFANNPSEFTDTDQPSLLVTDEACPADPATIIKTIDRLVSDIGDSPQPHELDQYFEPGEFNNLATFSLAAARMRMANLEYKRDSDLLKERIRQATELGETEVAERLGVALSALTIGAQNEILDLYELINFALGRDPYKTE